MRTNWDTLAVSREWGSNPCSRGPASTIFKPQFNIQSLIQIKTKRRQTHMKKKKGRQRQWQTQIQKFSAAADGKVGADESNSGNPNTPHKCKNGISITWNCANEVLGNFAFKNMWYKQICIPRVQMWANMQMRKCEMCKYANEKMSKCRKPQVLGHRSVASPQLGNWLQNLIQHLGISNPLEYTRILAQNNKGLKIPKIHTNIGTK